MRSRLLALCLGALGVLCAAAGWPRARQQQGDVWDRALAAVGLTRQTCRFNLLDMANFGGADHVLPFFEAVHRAPLSIPYYTRVVRESALSAGGSAGALTMLTAQRMGAGVRRNLLGDPNQAELDASKEPDALVNAVEAVRRTAGEPMTPAQRAALVRRVAQIPSAVAQPAAFLLLVEMKALRWRERAFGRLSGHDLNALFLKLLKPEVLTGGELDEEVVRLMAAVDLRYLLVGAIDLALAVDRAAEILGASLSADFAKVEIETPLGWICLGGNGRDTYAAKRPYLLIVDVGGDDVYHGGGATHDSRHPVSVLLDMAGNDRYVAPEELGNQPISAYARRKEGVASPSFGAGLLGYGMLLDAAGDDVYKGLDLTQGCGLFGAGVLVDRAGNDRYESYRMAQGAAQFGVGVLADRGGTDEYRCFTTSQGYGGTRGCGLLVDGGAGNDLFEANDALIDFPSPQTKDHNVSLAQGAGYGRRADYSDGHSLAGGVGILVAEGGDNQFRAGVFAQGTGYWYGLGILSSGPGDDSYAGVWYVQASSAHFAVGALRDEGGNDRYRSTMATSIGVGHDFGTGFLVDLGGNDVYEGGGLCLGSGNANGIGVLWDRQGNDRYSATGPALGYAGMEEAMRGTLRERNLTLGLFLDTGGMDTYPQERTYARDGTVWRFAEVGKPLFAAAVGCGMDTEGAPGEPE